ncbi:HAMP domain-containing histidine kinase [Fibrella aestuarina]|uniref:histidine kinase n=1 Tax=Fibrivirga algicola TaxID=2950420 RepID=A0ABX0QB95_9BACT|nr:two-component sensor histidine kinase [Fibrella sp. ES10-3-2-2]NID09147.1 HAMP domain-containing histidine kinase [Fibrivirga algicola]
MSALCYTFLENNAPGATDEQYVASIQNRIKSESKQSLKELSQLTARLATLPNYTFNSLNYPSNYPYFIFKNKRLLYWSDNRFIPDFNRIVAIRYPKLVDFDQGRFIVSHNRTFRKKDTLDVFSLIVVYRRYTTTNSFLQSGYNPALFSLDPQSLTTTKGAAYQNIYDATPVFLFSVTPPKVDPFRNRYTPVNTVILATLGVLFLGLYVIRRLRWCAQVRRYEVGLLWLSGYLLMLRGVMLYMGVPYLFIENDLFSAKHYASSELAPSLGDLMLNGIALMAVAFYLVLNFYRSRTYGLLISQPPVVWRVVSVCLVFASNLVYFACFNQLNALYEKSQYTLNLALTLDISALKIASLLFFIILSVIYFLVQHILVSLFIRLNRRLLKGTSLFLIGTLISLVFLVLASDQLEPLYLLNTVYFGALYLSKFPRLLYTFSYRTSLYFFLGSFICASTAASVVYRQQIREDLFIKRDLGENLLAENDEYGELLLHKAQGFINGDPDIQRAFVTDTLVARRERIQNRIKSLHLDKYFDRYDTEVSSFDVGGTPLDASENATSLSEYVRRFQQKKYKTKYDNLFFINEVGNKFIKEYVNFVNMYAPDSSIIGYVVLDLKLLKETPTLVYPALLFNDRLVQSPKIQQYSHAVYERSPGKSTLRLKHNTGSYNYERKLPQTTLAGHTLYDEGVTIEGFRHLGIRGTNGRTLVVSSPEYSYGNVFANFSFLYLILILSVIGVILLYAVQYGFSRFSLNYSTRIQILLNLAFFLPLLLVVLIILGVISSNYVRNQESNYVSNTKNIAANFQAYLDEHVRQVRSKEAMEQELETIARDADIDINLFDTTGRLYSTTRKLMYESGHLSTYINPLAYIRISEDKENQILLNESLGTKKFSTAYAGIKSFDGQHLMGILSIPYFYAQPELDRQLLEVISSALSVFTALFLLFLVLSYFASSSITKPLWMMTQKIRRTSLDRLNQTIEWHSDDEIGALVKEYNRMLTKLEESKFSLAQSEKQSAWREMAKQVAHEIKNPLTPMKLTLQQLQRTLPGTNPQTDRAVSRTLDSLLDQIDNISDIATSFSDFANMPMPQNELVELTSVVHKAADLYADDKRVFIRRQIAVGPIWIMGDRQLLMRIMTNLIINGIQSVPPDQTPVIDLRLFSTDGNANIEVHDNGQGISESIRSKVFLPNFSTKQGGTGIGLAISKRGIEHAGGSIWFETALDVGTSFFIAIPLANSTKASDN